MSDQCTSRTSRSGTNTSSNKRANQLRRLCDCEVMLAVAVAVEVAAVVAIKDHERHMNMFANKYETKAIFSGVAGSKKRTSIA